MRICTRSTRSSITKSAGRILLVFGHLAACGMVPLVAMWPAGDPNPQMTEMFLAVRGGNVAAMDAILRRGLDVDCCDETGITPLMAAARAGQVDAVRKILAAGARIDACAPVFGTPLMVAVVSGRHDIMRELIERGADVDAANLTGQTALWSARLGGDEEAVRILIAGGACAEGDSTAPSEAGVIEQGADMRTPSETRAIETSDSAVPAGAAGLESLFVRSAQ